MNIKVICILTVLTRVHCVHQSSKLLEKMKTIAVEGNNQEIQWDYLRKTEKKGLNERLQLRVSFSDYDYPALSGFKLLPNKRNIRKRKVVDVGINCPHGTVQLPGETICRCIENENCTITRQVGNKTQIAQY